MPELIQDTMSVAFPTKTVKHPYLRRSKWHHLTRSSSGDKIANMNCFTMTSYTYYKVH